MRAIDDFNMIIKCEIPSSSGSVVTAEFDIFPYLQEYRLNGGPEQPMRYITVFVNKLNIDKLVVEGSDGNNYTLIDNIVQGRTQLYTHAVGTGTFIITKVELSDYLYTITAYGIEVILNSTILNQSIITSIMGTGATQLKGRASWVAEQVVRYWFENGLGLTDVSQSEGRHYTSYLSSSFKTGSTYNGTMVSFVSGISLMSIIQICALVENAFAFFADSYVGSLSEYVDTFYFVNYDDSLPLASNPLSTYNADGFRAGESMDGVLNIYPKLNNEYENYSEMDWFMYTHAVALNSQSSEGADTIVNAQTVQIQTEGGTLAYIYNDDGSESSNTYTGASASIRSYGEYGGTVLVLSQLRGVYVDSNGDEVSPSTSGAHYNIEDLAKAIANNIVKRYRDPSQTIVAMMAETTSMTVSGVQKTAWEMVFPAYSHVNAIHDDVNDIHLYRYHECDRQYFSENPNITNKSLDNSLLRLSTFTYCYPELATRYRFGVSKQADLTQTLATLMKSSSS